MVQSNQDSPESLGRTVWVSLAECAFVKLAVPPLRKVGTATFRHYSPLLRRLTPEGSSDCVMFSWCGVSTLERRVSYNK